MSRIGLIILLIDLVLTIQGQEKPSNLSSRWDVFPQTALVDRSISFPTSPTLTKSLGDAAEYVLRWTPPATAVAWNQRRPAVEKALRKSLGLEKYPDRTPLNPRILAHHDFEGYSIENVVFESRPGFLVTGNLYRPKVDTISKHAAILSPIGHFLTPGKTAPDVQARCIKLAERGFIVLTYDAIGQGERMFAGNIHHDAGYALLPIGETIAGWMVWDSMRSIDYLLTLDDVDPQRVGITGNSGGGLNSLLTAALDKRVSAAVVVGFTFEFNNWLKYGGPHCTCTHWPGIFQEMEWFEIAGLIAPRPLMMIQGANDNIFPISGARRSAAKVRTIYQLEGVDQNVRLVELADQPHAYSRPFRERMYGWMDRHLYNKGNGESIAEGSVNPLPEMDPQILCDVNRTLATKMPTVVDFARRRAMEMLDALPSVDVTNKHTEVLDWINASAAAPEALSHWLSPKTHRKTTFSGGSLEYISFNSEDGQIIPGLVWMPTNQPAPFSVILMVHSQGKAAVAESGWVTPLLQSGYAVVSVDLRGRGETLAHYGPNYDANFRLIANQVLMGQPLAGRRAFDLRRSIDYLARRQEFKRDDLTLIAVGDDALPATLAAAIDPRIRQVVVAGYVHSFISQIRARIPPPLSGMGDAWNDPQLSGGILTENGRIDFGSVVPSVLKVADIPELISLISPRRILLCQMSDLNAPDIGALSDRLKRIAVTWPDVVRYLPTQRLDFELLLQWLTQKD